MYFHNDHQNESRIGDPTTPYWYNDIFWFILSRDPVKSHSTDMCVYRGRLVNQELQGVRSVCIKQECIPVECVLSAAVAVSPVTHDPQPCMPLPCTPCHAHPTALHTLPTTTDAPTSMYAPCHTHPLSHMPPATHAPWQRTPMSAMLRIH